MNTLYLWSHFLLSQSILFLLKDKKGLPITKIMDICFSQNKCPKNHLIYSIISISPCSNFIAIGKRCFSGSPVWSTNFERGPKFSSNFFLMSLFIQVCILCIFLHFLNILIFTHSSGIGISSNKR